MQAAPLQSPLSCFRERWENGERTEVGGGNASSQYFYFSDRLSLYFLYFSFWEEGMMLQLKLYVYTSLRS